MNEHPCSNCGRGLRALRGLALCPACDRPAIRHMQGQKPAPMGDALLPGDPRRTP